MIIVEILLLAIGLTIGYFLIKEAVKKAILEAHEEMGDYHMNVTQKKPVQKETSLVKQTISETTKNNEKSSSFSSWICPHCETINSSDFTRCQKCKKLPGQR